MTTFYGWETNAFTHNHDVILSESLLLFFGLLAICLLVQYTIKVSHFKLFPESVATMLISLLLGGILRLSFGGKISEILVVSSFNVDVFRLAFLPPIIYNSGFHLRRKLFYGNRLPILSLAFIGTIGSAILIAVGIYYLSRCHLSVNFPEISWTEAIAFGSLLSSTDPVATLTLYSTLRVEPALLTLVLGESVLNDAVAITVFKSAILLIEKNVGTIDIVTGLVNFIIIFVGSAIIGYGLILCFAWSLKRIDLSHSSVEAMSIIVCTIFIPFFLADMLQLSGIVAIFFSGIAARRHIHKGNTNKVKILSSQLFKLLSHIGETSCFCLLGLSIFLDNNMSYSILLFATFLLIFCNISRAIMVYGLLFLVSFYVPMLALF